MNKLYSFNKCDRIAAVLNGFHGERISIEDALNRYADAVRVDLAALVESALPHFFDFAKQDFTRFEVTLDKYDLKPNAKIQPLADRFKISISLGMILAIDDVTSILCRWRFPDEPATWDYIDAQYFIEPKFLDYDFLLKIEKPGRSENFVYAYPSIPASEEMFEYFVVAANFAILWTLLHEIGHVQLGHLGEGGIEEAGESDDAGARLKICQEFAADMYASSRFFSTFMRNDAIERIFPRRAKTATIMAIDFLLRAAIVPSCILHRIQVPTMEGTPSLGDYPEPTVRLFNVLACVWPTVDNNRRLIRTWLAAQGYDHVLREFKEYEITGPVVLNIGWIDRLLEYMGSLPLLPWRISVDINILPGNKKLVKFSYIPVDPEIILKAEAEIAAAALLACRGVAVFRAVTFFSPSYSKWRSTILLCRDLWIGQLEAVDRLGPPGFGWPLEENPDLHRYLVLSLFREIATSVDELDENPGFIGEFERLTATLESNKRQCAPPTVPGSWPKDPSIFREDSCT